MDQTPASSVVLLSVKPRFAEAIMAGRKKVEFRKTRFQGQVTHAIVYASSPIRKVIGYFAISSVVVDSLGNLWRRYGRISEVDLRLFRMYFSDRQQGVAIRIGEVIRLHRPVELSAIDASLAPPQSFLYLRHNALKRFRQLADLSNSSVTSD